MRILNTTLLFIAPMALLLSGHAMALDDDPGPRDFSATAMQATAQDDDPGEWGLVATKSSVVVPRNDSVFGSALAVQTLDTFRGGTEVVANDMRLSGTTAQNSANYVMTGDNTISAGSFANLNGVPMVIQNSGANVLIQNATIINLQLH
jgi:hypothetical protein